MKVKMYCAGSIQQGMMRMVRLCYDKHSLDKLVLNTNQFLSIIWFAVVVYM